jgi:flagellar hook-length control protein FliK
MQLSIVSLLIPGAQAAVLPQADAGDASDASFASLLGTSDLLSGDGQSAPGQQQKGDLPIDVAANSLIAQEIEPNALLQHAGKSHAGLAELSGDDIAHLKQALADYFSARGDAPTQNNDEKDKALQELRDQLEQVDASADTTNTDALIQQLPSVEGEKDNAARAEIASRILGFIQGALKKAPAITQASNTANQAPLAVAQTELAHATLFRRTTGEANAAETQAPKTEQETTDYALDDTAASTGNAAAIPLWVQHIGVKEAALPKVNLPVATHRGENKGVVKSESASLNNEGSNASATDENDILDALVQIDHAAKKSDAARKAGDDAKQDAGSFLTALNESGTPAELRSEATAIASEAKLNITASSPNAHKPVTYTEHAKHAISPHVVADQVVVAVKHAKEDGIERITIQLQPNDLGHVEVKLESHSDGRSHIVFTADKADTLEILQRDVRMLERSLQEAGIKTDAGTMEFNLRQQPQPQAQMGGGHGQGNPQSQQQQEAFAQQLSGNADGTELEAVESVTASVEQQVYSVNYGLDVRV